MATSVFKAGAGKAAIGYPADFFPYKGFRGRSLDGVHDDIHARALLMELDGERFLIISLELGDITDDWIGEISEKTGIPSDHIWLTVTHNHPVPYAKGTWGEDVPDAEKTEPFCRCCIDAIFEATNQAESSLCPASLRYGEGEAYVNVNRDVKYNGSQPEYTAPYIIAKNIHGYSDHTVTVLDFVDESGKTIACVVGYAVHSSALFRQFWDDDPGSIPVSGDLSGAAMRYVEDRTDAVAIHLLGAAADQNARFCIEDIVFDKDGNVQSVYRDAGAYDMVEYMAEELGDEVLRVSETAADIPTERLKAAKTVISAPTKEKYEDGPPMFLPVDYEWKMTGEIGLPLFMIQIGSLALFGIPGEIVARVGTNIKSVLKENGFARAMVVTQCNGSFSYMTDEEGYSKKTFEAVQSHFAPGIAGLIEKGAIELTRNCLE